MSHLQLSALLVSEGLLTAEEIAALRSGLGPAESLEDALRARGLVDPTTLNRLLSLAQTPIPAEGTVHPGRPIDDTATMWEYEVPVIEGLEDDEDDGSEVSMDAPTGRFEGLRPVGNTTRWDREIPETGKLTGRTTRWEIPVPLPEDNPTGDWALGAEPAAQDRPPLEDQSPRDKKRLSSGLLDSTSIEDGFETQIEES